MTIEKLNPGAKSISSKSYNQMASASEQVQAWQNPFGGKSSPLKNNGNIFIDSYNNSDSAIDVFAPVELTEPIPLLADDNIAYSFNAKRPAFKVQPATDKIKNFAISQNKIISKEVGPVLLQGITTAQMKINNGAHQYAKVNSDGKLESTSLSACRILWKAGTSGTVWAILQLGGTGGGGNNYTGFFRLVQSEDKENTIDIVDGTGTLGNNCGIYVSGIDKIEVLKKSLTITAESYIMFYATYDTENKKWTIEIKAESSIPDFSEDKFAALLGVVKWNSEDPENEKMGQVVQVWNNGIIYNNRYS